MNLQKFVVGNYNVTDTMTQQIAIAMSFPVFFFNMSLYTSPSYVHSNEDPLFDTFV